jgi:DNA-binding CsgD family transcriptional regulator
VLPAHRGFPTYQQNSNSSSSAGGETKRRLRSKPRRLPPPASQPARDRIWWPHTSPCWTDFIEAAARSGRDAEAVTALDRLTARATAGDGRLGLGRLARSRALLAPDHEAEEQYRRSVEVFGTANSPTELARSHLVYGEWLRRQRRRREAREQLGAALDAFAGMGAQGFAGRAQAELEATGVHPTTRRPGAPSGLTAQETQVARLAAAGDTNREAAAKLFLSPATVDHHLRHIYQKLGVSSRTQLARKMSEAH